MKSVSICLRAALGLGALLLALPLPAQITATAPANTDAGALQRFDIYGGADYSHFNPGFAHQVRATNLLGWQGSATAWFAKLYGVEASVRGLYGSYPLPASSGLSGNSKMSEHLFLFGPNFRLLQRAKYTAGMHVLIGGAYGSFDQGYAGTGIQPYQTGVYNNQLALGSVIGGWADYNLRSKFAVRFVSDYQPTRYGGYIQNEFNGAVGIVYKIGSRTR